MQKYIYWQTNLDNLGEHGFYIRTSLSIRCARVKKTNIDNVGEYG